MTPTSGPLQHPACDPAFWSLDSRVVFLNHGAFGACPTPVLDHQSEWRARMERQPLQFMVRDLERHLDLARHALCNFVGADEADLVFVPNATTGVNTVLRSLEFNPGDELLVTDHEYNASRNALDYVAHRARARVVVVRIPFPFQHEDELVEPILAAVSSRTRLALVDHVTSQTGMIMPVARIISELSQRGVDTLVDGAHAPGMIPLELRRLGAAFYTGNCHKWLCSPKGAAFLHVGRDRQKWIRPLSISHGANSPRTDRSRFLIEFGWTGTDDPSAWLSVPMALRFMGSLLHDGWMGVIARNHALALAGRETLCEALNIPVPCPDRFIAALASIPLPDAPASGLPYPPFFEYPLQDRLRDRHQIEVPILSWPTAPKRVLRIAPQLYNSLPQYGQLARALREELNSE